MTRRCALWLATIRDRTQSVIKVLPRYCLAFRLLSSFSKNGNRAFHVNDLPDYLKKDIGLIVENDCSAKNVRSVINQAPWL